MMRQCSSFLPELACSCSAGPPLIFPDEGRFRAGTAITMRPLLDFARTRLSSSDLLLSSRSCSWRTLRHSQ
jgi:hypothetical protein